MLEEIEQYALINKIPIMEKEGINYLTNFKIDGELVEFSGLTDNKYKVNFGFKIGQLDAVGTLINTIKFKDTLSLRLHTVPTTSTPEGHDGKHFIKVDVSDVDSFAFDFGVTTGAFAYIQNIRVDFTFKK